MQMPHTPPDWKEELALAVLKWLNRTSAVIMVPACIVLFVFLLPFLIAWGLLRLLAYTRLWTAILVVIGAVQLLIVMAVGVGATNFVWLQVTEGENFKAILETSGPAVLYFSAPLWLLVITVPLVLCAALARVFSSLDKFHYLVTGKPLLYEQFPDSYPPQMGS